jgi:hypothetical protein
MHRLSLVVSFVLIITTAAFSQDSGSETPAASRELLEEIRELLEAAREPLTPEQTAALLPVLEDSLRETPQGATLVISQQLRKRAGDLLTAVQANALQRAEAGQLLLSRGVEGLRALLAAADAPALTFDQETQVQDVHDEHLRALNALLRANGGVRDTIEAQVRELEDQSLLAAMKFLNPAQRTALTGSVSAADFVALNSDLPEDPDELREFLSNLRSPAGNTGGNNNFGNFGGFGGGGGGGGNNNFGGGGGGGNNNFGNFGGGGGGLSINGFGNSRMPDRNEILEIRINENSFTAENSNQSRGQTQIITRGGTGRLNGDAQFRFADESLDARNAFASSRPPYQQRDSNVNVSGPVIRNRLTMTLGVTHDTSEEGGNIYALTPNGLINDAIVRPGRNRSYNVRSTGQLSENHVLNMAFNTGKQSNDLNNVGQTSLPEHGSRNARDNTSFQARETAVLSGRINHEVSLSVTRFSQENRRITQAPNINVLGSFRGGGNTNDNINRVRSMQFGNLLMYTGSKISWRAGYSGSQQILQSENRNNFLGSFVFGSLFDYCGATGFAGSQCQIELQANPGRTPNPALTYSVNQGDPDLEVNVFSSAAFFQSDWRVLPTLTLSFGARHEWQTNLDDYNNLAPRLGFAYSLGRNTVLRGGTGIFYQRLDMGTLNNLRRLDGTLQTSYVVRNPTYPDPFAGGAQASPRDAEIRVRDEALVAPYTWNSEVSLETTTGSGFVLTGSYRFIRGVHLYRSRNINAPYDITSLVIRSCQLGQPASECLRPDPTRGNVNQFESTGSSSGHNLSAGFRKRLRFLNFNGSYNFNSSYSDVGGDFDLPADNHNLDSEWGRSGERHRINASVNIRLPWNVNADSIFNWNTGQPYTLTTGSDDNQDSNTDDRPAGVPRNSLTGPGFFEMDLNLSKSFQLRSDRVQISDGGSSGSSGPVAGGGYYGQRTGLRMTLTATINNLLNKVNFQDYSGVMTSSFFGKPTRARAARSVQLSLRFNF